MTTSLPVIFKEIKSNNGYVAIATINRESSLNAMNHESVQLLWAQLKEWEASNDIKCIFVNGAGERSFCAGGDIREASIALQGSDKELQKAKQFISDEYNFEYEVTTFTTPVIAWATGVVMGAGFGLMAACSHRIVTETTRAAMPEVKIGLYPDVGATKFLGSLPHSLGTYIGMTACMLNASDCIYINVADYLIQSSNKEELIKRLIDQKWTNMNELNCEIVDQILTTFPTPDTCASNLKENLSFIKTLAELTSIEDKYNSLIESTPENDWQKQNIQNAKYASPLALKLLEYQMNLCGELTREEAKDLELAMSLNIFKHKSEFSEGVRALLIDKDFNPDWTYKTLKDVPKDIIIKYLAS